MLIYLMKVLFGFGLVALGLLQLLNPIEALRVTFILPRLVAGTSLDDLFAPRSRRFLHLLNTDIHQFSIEFPDVVSLTRFQGAFVILGALCLLLVTLLDISKL
jgi:hypothetical protein